jgi:post-segregation antitoxin (ccd killing protein)
VARVNLSLPDELAREVAERLPGLNVSAVLQDALRARLRCDHRELACASCSEPIDRHALEDRAVDRFYADALWELDELVRRGGTAEGAARVVQRVAASHGATRRPLPRPTRAERHRNKVRPLLAADRRELA